MTWIDTHIAKPTSPYIICLVTDGEIVCLARWINDVRKWYGESLTDGDNDPIEQKFIESNCCWEYLIHAGKFKNSEECFGELDEIYYWMPLPTFKEMKNMNI